MRYNILSVDELGITRIELTNLLKNMNVNITGVKNEFELINTLHENKSGIHAIVWTVNSTDFNEFEAIRRIKGKEAYKQIPIVIISKFTDKKYIIKAIECGAVEYIAKPYDEATVVKKMSKVLGLPLDSAAGKKVEDDIITFSLSEMLSREIKAASRGGYPLSLMLVSVINGSNDDDSRNNTEDIIDLINKVIKTKLRETDSTFRYSSDNLIILLPFADPKGAATVEQKIQGIFNTHSLIKQKNKGCVLVAASVTYPEDGKIKDKLLDKLESKFEEIAGAIS